MVAVEVVSAVLNPTGYLISKLVEKVASSSAGTEAGKASIEELQLEARKQEIAMEMAQIQAKVAQELAIAKRIEIAAVVEIEEFYDVSGNARAGVKATAETISAGISGGGKKVTKRIYKFRGFDSEAFPQERIEKMDTESGSEIK